MKKLTSLIIFVGLVINVSSQDQPKNLKEAFKADWLIGTWESKNDEGQVVSSVTFGWKIQDVLMFRESKGSDGKVRSFAIISLDTDEGKVLMHYHSSREASIGELQVEAFKIEYNFESLHIVRPANIYGPYANFDPENSMVISSLIRRIIEGENPLIVWGNGTAVRDFIFSADVAEAMIQVMQKKIEKPINIGSGTGISIKTLVNTLLSSVLIKKKPKVIFDKTKPTGDKKRILDTSLAKGHGITNKVSLKEGLDKTINWYLNNRSLTHKRFNYFKKN